MLRIFQVGVYLRGGFGGCWLSEPKGKPRRGAEIWLITLGNIVKNKQEKRNYGPDSVVATERKGELVQEPELIWWKNSLFAQQTARFNKLNRLYILSLSLSFSVLGSAPTALQQNTSGFLLNINTHHTSCISITRGRIHLAELETNWGSWWNEEGQHRNWVECYFDE